MAHGLSQLHDGVKEPFAQVVGHRAAHDDAEEEDPDSLRKIESNIEAVVQQHADAPGKGIHQADFRHNQKAESQLHGKPGRFFDFHSFTTL